MMGLLRIPNLYAYGALVALGALIVVGIFNAGARHNQMRHDSATAKVNLPIVEQRGKDEAEIAAEAEASKKSDAVVAGAISQQCVLTSETAKLLASVR